MRSMPRRRSRRCWPARSRGASRGRAIYLGLNARKTRFPLKRTCLAIYSHAVNAEAPLEAVLARAFPWCVAWESDLSRPQRPQDALSTEADLPRDLLACGQCRGAARGGAGPRVPVVRRVGERAISASTPARRAFH